MKTPKTPKEEKGKDKQPEMLFTIWITRGERNSSQWKKFYIWDNKPIFCEAKRLYKTSNFMHHETNYTLMGVWRPDDKMGYWIGKSHIPLKAIRPRDLARILGAQSRYLLQGGKRAIYCHVISQETKTRLGVAISPHSQT